MKQDSFSAKRAPQNKGYRVYSWAEIVKHDKPGDCWIVISGKVYDVSKFVPDHPGGDMIYDGGGGDCTSMFESYHPSYMTKKGPPSELIVGEVLDYKDFYSYEGNFYHELKVEVEKKIPRTKRKRDWRLYLKAVIWITLYWCSIAHWLIYCNFWSTVLIAITGSQMGVNVMHDGNHGAFSNNKWVSAFAGNTLEFTGDSSTVYRRSHNFGHHGCVNHVELDRSFDTTFPFIRMSTIQPLLWFHKYQGTYIWIFYSFVNFGNLFGAFDEMFWLSNYPSRRGSLRAFDLWTHQIAVVGWLVIMVFYPAFKLGWYDYYPLFMAYMFLMSNGYSWFFAVNHWTEDANQVDNSTIGKTNWGALQVENSTNFAIDSPFWTHLSGGLNFQIEHHLFPSYAHTRLSEISEIVQKYCKKYNLKYSCYKTFGSAIMSHYRLLKRLSVE